MISDTLGQITSFTSRHWEKSLIYFKLNTILEHNISSALDFSLQNIKQKYTV